MYSTYYIVIIIVKWKVFDDATLFRLLKPVASSWEELARFLLKDELLYEIETIKTDAFHKNSQALITVLTEWRDCTKRVKRTWQTLCDTAKKYRDESLEQYIQERHLESESEFHGTYQCM